MASAESLTNKLANGDKIANTAECPANVHLGKTSALSL